MNAETREADMTISGVALTVGESMTVRCAVQEFAMTLADGLGNDAHGKVMTKHYLEAIRNINRLIARTAK